MAWSKKIKLEHVPSQPVTAGPCDASRAPARQSPTAAPSPNQGHPPQHQGHPPSQACPVHTSADNRQLAEAVQQEQTSAPTPCLQQVLSLFRADTAVSLAAKGSALTQMAMLVAGSM